MSAAAPRVRGWCPGALRPMLSGDGMLLRVRPMLGEVSAEAMRGLCDLAGRHGNGLIDLTSRANLQLRGVPEGDVSTLTDGLRALGLLDPDPDIESRRNIVIEAGWRPGDLSHRIATELMGLLGDLPKLPGKFGFAIDTGAEPAVNMVASDVAFELAADGGLILRADGAPLGRRLRIGEALQGLREMLDWFIATGGQDTGRMARHLRHAKLPPDWLAAAPRSYASLPKPGQSGADLTLGAAFGALEARAMITLLDSTGARALRPMPGRLFRLMGVAEGAVEAARDAGFITTPDDPALAVHACPGAPYCAQAEAGTRALARALCDQLGPRLTPGQSLHVSGCAKGCAWPRAADLTLVGRHGAYDLLRNAAPWDTPEARDLTDTDILKLTEF